MHAEVMNRNEITEKIVVARLTHGLTWQELADAMHAAWVAFAIAEAWRCSLIARSSVSFSSSERT